MTVMKFPFALGREPCGGRSVFAALLFLALSMVFVAQVFARQTRVSAQIEGVVHDSAGKAVADVTVRLQKKGHSDSLGESTNPDGTFVFSTLNAGTYTLTLRKAGFRDTIDTIELAAAETKRCTLVMAASDSSVIAVQLDDRPNFTVAGVTDTSGSGGHGSETRLRAGEALARETVSLEPTDAARNSAGPTNESAMSAAASENLLRAELLRDPHSYEANHRLGEFYFRAEKYSVAIPPLRAAYQSNPHDRENGFTLARALAADGDFTQAREQVNRMLASEPSPPPQDESSLHHLLGDLDEKLGDPLAAEHEYERTAELDSSEQNYFAWGGELLLHRAVAPAIEVFGRGVRLHPESTRMLAGLGAALYTSGSAEEGAHRLCQASDLDPGNPTFYLFLGKMQEASSTPLPCVEAQLERFAKGQPGSALANYYYALALWKRERSAQNSDSAQRAEVLLQRAVQIDPQFDFAYLQLGDLYSARADLPAAFAAYQKAAAINPAGSQNHYRLGLTYRRMGEEAKAQREFDRYKELEKKEADQIELRRREVGQFLFVLGDAQEAPGK